MERKPPKFPTGMMQPSKPMVSRRRANMQEDRMPPPATPPMGGRKPRKPAGNPMNPMGSGKPKRGMY